MSWDNIHILHIRGKMNTKIFFLIGLLVLIKTSLSSALGAQLVTLHYPPLVSKTKIAGIKNGLYLDITKLIFSEASIPLDISFAPVKRSIKIFSSGQIPFFLGSRDILNDMGVKDQNIETITLGFFYMSFYYLAKRYPEKITYKQLSDLKSYRIGITRGSSLITIFEKAGLEVDVTNGPETNARKLFENRINLWVVADLTAQYIIKSHFPSRVSQIAVIKPAIFKGEAVLSYLKSNQSAKKIFKKLRASFKKIKRNGMYTKILQGYQGNTRSR